MVTKFNTLTPNTSTTKRGVTPTRNKFIWSNFSKTATVICESENPRKQIMVRLSKGISDFGGIYGCSISDLQGDLSKRSGWRACYAECNTRAMQVTGLHATEDDATCRHVTCQPHAIHMPHATGHSINDGPLSSVDMYFLVRWPSTYHLIYSITASDWHLLFRWLRQCLFRRVPLHGIFVIIFVFGAFDLTKSLFDLEGGWRKVQERVRKFKFDFVTKQFLTTFSDSRVSTNYSKIRFNFELGFKNDSFINKHGLPSIQYIWTKYNHGNYRNSIVAMD